MDRYAEWVANHGRYEHTGKRLPDDQFERCVAALCSIGSPYNTGGSDGRGWLVTPWHVSLRMPRKPLATHDLNELTSLVLAAHVHRVRVQVEGVPGGPGGAATLVSAWPRSATADHPWEHHPGIDALAATLAAISQEAKP